MRNFFKLFLKELFVNVYIEGSYLLVHKGMEDLELDGSISLDPDNEDIRPKWSWSCRKVRICKESSICLNHV